MSGSAGEPAGTPPGDPARAGESFFAEAGMDRFVAVILNMASEMWVMEERLRALESGPAAPQPEADPAAFVARIFAPLRETRR